MFATLEAFSSNDIQHVDPKTPVLFVTKGGEALFGLTLRAISPTEFCIVVDVQLLKILQNPSHAFWCGWSDRIFLSVSDQFLTSFVQLLKILRDPSVLVQMHSYPLIS